MKNLGLVLKRLHRPASSYIKGISLEIKDDTLLDVFRTSCEKYSTKMMGSLKVFLLKIVSNTFQLLSILTGQHLLSKKWTNTRPKLPQVLFRWELIREALQILHPKICSIKISLYLSYF